MLYICHRIISIDIHSINIYIHANLSSLFILNNLAVIARIHAMVFVFCLSQKCQIREEEHLEKSKSLNRVNSFVLNFS